MCNIKGTTWSRGINNIYIGTIEVRVALENITQTPAFMCIYVHIPSLSTLVQLPVHILYYSLLCACSNVCLCYAGGVLGLQRTAYEIEEGGKLEVCVVVTTPAVKCPFVFPVIIYLELSSITAGIYTT